MAHIKEKCTDRAATLCVPRGDSHITSHASGKRVYRVMKVHAARSPCWLCRAKALVRTIKRDYVRVSPRPNAESVMRQLPSWIAHYNEVHPREALGYRSPRVHSIFTSGALE
jgi:transposase InsO family protein